MPMPLPLAEAGTATEAPPAPVQEPVAPSPPQARTLSVALINPKFEPSYWGFEYALPLYPGDRRSTMINGALPTLAGLVGVAGDHEVVLIDENVEEIDWKAYLSGYLSSVADAARTPGPSVDHPRAPPASRPRR